MKPKKPKQIEVKNELWIPLHLIKVFRPNICLYYEGDFSEIQDAVRGYERE